MPARPVLRFDSVPTLVRTLRPADPVFCIRPRVIRDAAARFVRAFPGTTLYALKCNPHPSVVRALHAGGVSHFDAASLREVAQIREDGYGDAGIHFMHPVKDRRAIAEAYGRYGVRSFVVDHPVELEKVFVETGGEDLFLFVRLKTPETRALYHLASKFGAEPEDAAALVCAAARRGASVGLTFHVGSQCLDPNAYRLAFEVVREVIARSGVVPACIDVGGGFPHPYPNVKAPPLEEYLTAIAAGLRSLELRGGVPLWAEPGRALVAAGCSLLAQVRLRKGEQLYINDGVYGSFSELIDSEYELPARLRSLRPVPQDPLREFVLHGPTCDSMDVLASRLQLPDSVEEGDWVEIDQLGAYSSALATRFNGFSLETFAEVFDRPPSRACRTNRSSLP